MASDPTHVIVGAALAGAKAAETLRSEGFDGRIVLVGAEPERPYERPPLSKEYLRGEAEREKVYVHEAGYYDEHDIELRSGVEVTEISPGDRRVTLAGGEEIAYEALLLATGAEPRRLPIPGADLEGVCVLRSLANSDTLRERLDGGGRVVVVGAGWIGSEVAASARQRGLEVALVEPQSVPLERVLGSEVGAFYRDVHARHGVELHMDTGVEAFEGDGAVHRVRTSKGDALECDFVVVGVGVAPRTALAERAGLEVDNGIVTDAALRTSAPGVFAAGDVAHAQHPLFGSLRVEHWHNALEQGPAAARSMLGQDVIYDRIPYFFSDQYDVGMEYAGHTPRGYDDVVFRGDREGGEFIAFWLLEGVVQAAMNVNVWEVTDTLQEIIRSQRTIDRSLLADPEAPLEQLAGTAG
jgi:3-phenylpropionate/trans-cinnamate dioxygenase ferredoxin reductase subunit